MFDQFDFQLDQLRSIKAVVTNVPSYRPDGLDAAAIEQSLATAEALRAAMQGKISLMDIARGELHEIAARCHELCVQVYAVMRSRYRRDAASADAIASLPVRDETPQATFERAQAMSELWAILPHPPGAAGPFVAWDGMGLPEFDAVLQQLDGQLQGMVALEQSFKQVQGEFVVNRTTMRRWISAALVQGRGQFRRGTPEREQIDAVPLPERQPRPGKGAFTEVGSPGPGAVRLGYESERAVTYRLLHKAPGATSYQRLPERLTSTVYEAVGLAQGVHRFKVQGMNARGLGVKSEPAEVRVLGA